VSKQAASKAERSPPLPRPRSLGMHGVRRGSRPTGAAAAEEERIAREQASLARRALAFRRKRDYSAEAMGTVARAVTANPDEYSLWAFRREALLHALAAPAPAPATSVDGTRAFADLWQAELDLAFSALKRHPKAYPAWQHRLWLLSNAGVSAALPDGLRDGALRSEFAMSGVLLARDGRNFHGWAHRMRVREAAPGASYSSASRELDFVTAKINDDFANYSAWHHRSALLPALHSAGAAGGEQGQFVGAELEFVRQAFYTEPDVQSAWFYHRWLLAGAPARGTKAAVRDKVCSDELAACQQLLDIEPDARWALHAEAYLLARLGRHAEAEPIYRRLVGIDPMRRGFYEYQLSKVCAAPDGAPSRPATPATS
jgi:geranylgeranyl transferase type-2 subunit alpha